MRLFGVTYSRREIESRVARIESIGGVRRMKLTEGPEAEVELIQVRTGAGLAYTVNASRCLDVALAEYCGVPLSWHSSVGDVHPASYDPEGLAWLRTAAGGLLMTCGLTQVGSPCVEDGQSLGLHGRAHHTSARHVSAEGRWNGDEYDVRVAGVVEETSLFGDSLRLTREIRSRLGESRLALRDVVENVGSAPAPLMVLYHFNFGFPLMDADTKVAMPSRKVVPRESGLTLDDLDSWQAPEANFRERVYYHEDLKTDSKGWTAVSVRNPRFPVAGGNVPLAVHLRWSTANLPRFVQWRMPSTSAYVLGIEPANCHVEGRSAERKRGTLLTLDAGKSVTFELELDVKAE